MKNVTFYFTLSKNDVDACNNILQKPFPVISYSSCMPAINFHCTVTSIENTAFTHLKAPVTSLIPVNGHTTNTRVFESCLSFASCIHGNKPQVGILTRH